MAKPPLMLFDADDWLTDPNLSMCSPATRGVWMDLLCAMHKAGRSGELRGTTEQLARAARCSTADIDHALTDLETTGAAEVSQRNLVYTIVSRRMAREHKERAQAAIRQARHRSNAESNGGVTNQSNSSLISLNRKVDLKEFVSFEDSVRKFILIEKRTSPKNGGERSMLAKTCLLVYRDNKIPEAVLESALEALQCVNGVRNPLGYLRTMLANKCLESGYGEFEVLLKSVKVPKSFYDQAASISQGG